MINTTVYRNKQDAAVALARHIFANRSREGAVHIAVSGGSTPKLLFELMAASPLRERIEWSNIHLYWVDERCVPPTDADSNYGMTYEAMLRHVPLPEAQVHRIRGEYDRDEEAKRYTELVCRNLPLREDGTPVFDVVILGMGADGHTSSIFPHQMNLLREATPYAVATHPTTGQSRIAMTGPTILAARHLVLHATGEDKGVVLRQIFDEEPEAEAYPMAYIIEHCANLNIYTDYDF